MSMPVMGEIRIFAGDYAPRDWAFCHGQLLAIAQYDALFSLLGNAFGGDGVTTFALPDLRSRVPICHGQGPGLPDYPFATAGGAETVTVTVNEMPAHTHMAMGNSAPGTTPNPENALPARPSPAGGYYKAPNSATTVAMSPEAVGTAGGSQPHNNIMPCQGLNYIIALFGIYPVRA